MESKNKPKQRIMKKLMFISGMLCLISGSVLAQFPGGVFSQQANKRKLLQAQNMALLWYGQYVRRGYTITSQGLDTAGGLKSNTAALHQTYFESLSQVNPEVRKYPGVKKLTGLSQQIIKTWQAEIAWQQKAGRLDTREMAYLKKVAAAMEQNVETDLKTLNELLTSGKVELTDAQRLEQTDLAAKEMQDKYVFTGHFTSRLRALANARIKDQAERKEMKKWYGIPN
jgi:hypothetical protein